MALESFYGGKPGYSPIIKGTFKSIQEMNDYFQDPTYTDVWYGELCIITPDSMYDADNGKIFRRTLKKQSSPDAQYGSLYAEYLGQIVGMPGGLPKVVFNTIDKVKTIPSQIGNENKDIWYPTGSDNGYIETSNDKPIENFATLNGSEGIEFVPGMQKDNNNNDIYNDNFEYTWLQMADPQSNVAESDGTRGTLHLGLKIPYMYLDTPTITSVAPSVPATVSSSDVGSDNKHHPFYRKYDFSIPDGLRGIGIKNLRIITKTQANGLTIYNPSQSDIIKYDNDGQAIGINTEAEKYEFGNNTPDSSSIWVYDLNIPKKQESNEVSSCICYAGDYKEIKEATLNENGTFTFTDNNGNTITTANSDNKVKWVTSTSMDTNIESNTYGDFTINYNFNPLENNPSINQNQSATYRLPLVKRITAFKESQSSGEKIKIELAHSTGDSKNLTLQKITGKDNNQNDIYEDYIFKYPTEVEITENGDYYYLNVTYNDGGESESLGPVGVTKTVTGLGSYIYMGKIETIESMGKIETIVVPDTSYFPKNINTEANPIALINEDIDSSNNIPFPSFSL